MHVPVALTIAGSDCSAGAGIQADLKTFQHFQVHGLTAVTCVVSETANTVRAIHAVPVEIVRDQIALLLESFPVASVKTGMLYSAEHVHMVADVLTQQPELQLVVDPVMVASTGDPLLRQDAIAAYRERLLPLARLMSPNLPEAEVLLERRISGPDALEPAARELAESFGTTVLLKGGHLEQNECLDLLTDGESVHRFTASRIATKASHGTGCTLSAAITAMLARGQSLQSAVETAKSYIGEALAESYTFQSPSGTTVHALNQGTSLRPHR